MTLRCNGRSLRSIHVYAVHELGLYGYCSLLLHFPLPSSHRTDIQYPLDYFKGVYQVRVGNVYLAEVCTRGAGGVGHSDKVTLTKALLNSDRVRPLKLVRKGIASEADSDLIKSNLNDAAEYIYIFLFLSVLFNMSSLDPVEVEVLSIMSRLRFGRTQP